MSCAAVPDWVAGYVGLPFRPHGRDRSGVDCWGLVRLVLMERAGLDLPAYVAGYEGTSRADARDIARLISDGESDYVAIVHGSERALDVVKFRVLGTTWHVGLVVARGVMLHIQEGIDAAIERYDGAAWSRRLAGIHRHRALAGR